MILLRWLLALVLCIAIPAAFAADVKISALPAASSANLTDEYPANQSGTTNKVTGDQIASLSITNTVTGSTATAGSIETWQTLTKNCTANTTVTMATCMTTNGVAAGMYHFEYVVVFLTGGTSAGLRLEIGSTNNMNPFHAVTTVLATSTAANAYSAHMLRNGATDGIWATTASANVTNNQVLSMAGVDTANAHQIAFINGTFQTTTSGSLFLQAASSRAAVGGGVGGQIQILATTTLRLRKIM